MTKRSRGRVSRRSRTAIQQICRAAMVAKREALRRPAPGDHPARLRLYRFSREELSRPAHRRRNIEIFITWPAATLARRWAKTPCRWLFRAAARRPCAHGAADRHRQSHACVGMAARRAGRVVKCDGADLRRGTSRRLPRRGLGRSRRGRRIRHGCGRTAHCLISALAGRASRSSRCCSRSSKSPIARFSSARRAWRRTPTPHGLRTQGAGATNKKGMRYRLRALPALARA